MVVRNEGPVVAPAEAQRRPHRTGAGGYEELTGGQGRAVYFRPERYGADELGPVRPVVRLAAAGEEPRELRLYDVSQNGLAFHWDGPDEPPPLGTVLPRLEVAFDGYTAYDGTARVSSLRGDPGEWLVGVAFLDSLMDVEDVLRLRDVRAWESSRPPHLGVAGRPWHVGGFETFKALVCELRMFLEDAGADFDALGSRHPSRPTCSIATSTRPRGPGWRASCRRSSSRPSSSRRRASTPPCAARPSRSGRPCASSRGGRCTRS